MITIGVDPGASGGIAYNLNGRTKAVKMPKYLSDLAQLLSYLKEQGQIIAFIERLSIRPDDVFVSQGGANMGKLFRIQKMMQNFEQLKALFDVCDIPYCFVSPMKWQSGLRVKGEEKADRKRRFKTIAASRHPEIPITLWNADALLIMDFGIQADAKWILQHVNERKKDLFS